MSKLIACLALLLLAACGTTVSQKSLAPSSSQAKLQVGEFRYRINGSETAFGLVSGIYKAEYEDHSGGTYYRGPTDCALIMDKKYEGGLYIGQSGSEPIYRIYYYIDDYRYAPKNPVQADPMLEQRIAKGVGNVGVGPSVVGGAIGGAVVAAMIERPQGEIWLMPTTEQLEIANFVKVNN